MNDLKDLIPRKEDTKVDRIKKHLKHARLILPARDEFLVQRAQQIRDKEAKKKGIDPLDSLVTIHLTEGDEWSFYEFIIANKFKLAWDELKWACERYDAMWRIGGGNMRCDQCNRILHWSDKQDIGASRDRFWQEMAYAAREMMEDGVEPAFPGYPECLRV